MEAEEPERRAYCGPIGGLRASDTWTWSNDALNREKTTEEHGRVRAVDRWTQSEKVQLRVTVALDATSWGPQPVAVLRATWKATEAQHSTSTAASSGRKTKRYR